MERDRRVPAHVTAAAPLADALERWQAAVMRLNTIDPLLTELVRLRAAQHHDCRRCKSVRSVAAKEAGFDESMTAKVERYESSDLPPRTKAALRLADALMTQPAELLDDVVVDLYQHFSRSELIELTLDVMKFNHQKVGVALGTDTPIADQLADLVFDVAGNARVHVNGERVAR